MGGSRRGRSGLGWQGACALTALLLWLHLPPLRTQTMLSNQNNQNLKEGLVSGKRAPHDSHCPPTVCGKTGKTGRIYGGTRAEPEWWPWQASLLLNGRHICGASLIASNWVVSAAHCFQRSLNPKDYHILLGYNQLSKPTNFSRKMSVSKVFVHPDYEKKHRFGSDIALLQLHRQAAFNSHILPACVPEANLHLYVDTACWISGWGMVTEDAFLPHPFQLQQAKLFTMENQLCSSFFPPPPNAKPSDIVTVHEEMLCAADFRNPPSICRGDSGGPLVCFLNNSWFLVGATSWSAPCYPPITPSVFTRISYFFNWIKATQAATPNADLATAPPEEKAPALTTMGGKGTILRPRIFLVLLSPATLLLLLLLQSL
ncbi:serine protease 40-like [Ochotona princeps]|uniref:serine protease 40-like n=1 Tax=Ochotona princeps TaxID=9978 RepID=UPI002714C1F6|nr:serine protease 40-like [Ochotona princeps]